MVELGPMLALLDKAVQLTELHQAHGALQVGHAVVVAQVLEVRQYVGFGTAVALLFRDARPVIAQRVHLLGQGVVISRYHAALTHGDGLAWVERESSREPQPARRAAFIGAAGGASGVLDKRDAGCSSCQRVHVRAQPEEVHRHDGPGSGGDLAWHLAHVHVERAAIHVHKYRLSSAVEHHVGGGYPGEGRHDHLIPRAYAQGGQDQVQSGRAAGGGYSVLHLMPFGEGLLEGRHLGPLGEPAAHQRLLNRQPLFFAHGRRRDGNVAVPDHAIMPASCRRRSTSPLWALRHTINRSRPSRRSTRALKAISCSAFFGQPTRFFTKVVPPGSYWISRSEPVTSRISSVSSLMLVFTPRPTL